MRLLSVCLSALTVLSASAQVDVNKMIQERMQQNQGQPGQTQGDAGSVKVEDDTSPYVPNHFIGSYRLEMHMFKKGTEEKDSPMNVRYAFQEDKTAMSVEMPEGKSKGMRMLYDLKNKHQYMLTEDGKGRKAAIKQKMKQVTLDTDKESATKDMKVTMTDEYKEVEGHRCRKILGVNEDSKGEWWMAQDIDVDMRQLMSMVKTKGGAAEAYEKIGGKGLPMEMTWEKLDGSDKIISHAKDVKIGAPDPAMFDLSGYEVTDMTAMPGFNR